jgi:TetR/AcrR family transcriptional regulator, repressor for neighboring sulfatase
MSTKSLVPADRRRKPELVRQEALAIARRLLIEGGPAAITLKAIGAEMAMSHANLIHHFGSAEALRGQLKSLMAEELTRTVTMLVRRRGDTAADVGEIVDTVFAAYAAGGIGKLVAWSAMTGDHQDMHGLDEAVRELVAALEPTIDGAEALARARAMVVLVSLMALGNSLIGKPLAKFVGGDTRDIRRLVVWLLEHVRSAEDWSAAGRE